MSSGRVVAACAVLVALVTALIVISGQATGRDGHGPAIRVVGLGDSVVAGSACDCKTYVQRYAKIVEDRTGSKVQSTNDGVSGLTSGGLLTELGSGKIVDDVRRADVVLITVGANDFAADLAAWQNGGCDQKCSTAAMPDLERNIARILARIRQLRASRPQQIAVTDYWNVFEDGEVADQDFGAGFAGWSDALTRSVNSAICSAARSGGASCVDLYTPFNAGGVAGLTRLLAADGDHPSAQGHQVIAHALAAAVMPGVGELPRRSATPSP